MKKRWAAWLLAALLTAAPLGVHASGEPSAAGKSASAETENAPSDESGGRAADGASAEASAPSDRLTISILGDSNSAYIGWSEGAAADTTNSTIRGNGVYFEESDMPVESMWWYIAAQELGAEILVNNSWIGSCVLAENEPYAGAGTEGWRDRCVNLHDDTGENAGEEPDIIAIFLGTCDCTFHYETLGYPGAVDHDALITPTDNGVVYRVPKTSAEAYAIMLDRITRRYPNAEIYCLTVPPRRDADFWQRYFVGLMNSIIRTEAAYFGAVVADIHEDSGIVSEPIFFDRYMMDLLHPNEAGMARIADVFVSAVRGEEPSRPPAPVFTPADAAAYLADEDAADAAAVLRRVAGR